MKRVVCHKTTTNDEMAWKKNGKTKKTIYQWGSKGGVSPTIWRLWVSRWTNNIRTFGGTAAIFKRSSSQKTKIDSIDGSISMELRVKGRGTKPLTNCIIQPYTEICNQTPERCPKCPSRTFNDGLNSGISRSQPPLYVDQLYTKIVEYLTKPCSPAVATTGSLFILCSAR